LRIVPRLDAPAFSTWRIEQMAARIFTVCCLGASLTAGSVSADYVEMLGQRPALRGFRFINHGANGDLAWNGLQRLDRVMADQPGAVTILIGTNDVNATLSERNRLRYHEFNHLPVTHPGLAWYEENLRAIIRRLQIGTRARLAVLSLAPIGEDLAHEANHRVEEYNETIRRIAAATKIDYLPLHERLLAYLKEHEAERAALPPRLEYRDGLVNIGNATALHHTGLSWNEVSRRNGLLLLTDGLHLNDTAAAMIVDLIEGWLLPR
jgi:lysophospholipase L1-like esterase